MAGKQVVIVGEVYDPGVGVGGGPIMPGQPPGIWGPTDPRPTPPIVLPIPPDSLAPGVPTHPIYLPVYPAHPIVIPPDTIAPGVPAHPIVLPPIISGPPGPWPTPPIVIPPDAVAPGVPAHPIYLPPSIWGPPGPWPTPPIVLPPEGSKPPTEPPLPSPEWTWVYTMVYGWCAQPPGGGGKPQPMPPTPPAQPRR